MIICITGPIASGKSTAARIIREEFHVPTINMDFVGHYVLSREDVIKAVSSILGSDVVVNGKLSRQRIAKKVFSDPVLLRRYTSFLHPIMKDALMNFVYFFKNKGYGMVVVEAALLFGTPWECVCDEVWSVIAPEKVIYRRLGTLKFHRFYKKRRKYQPTTEFYRKHSHITICNRATERELSDTLKQIWLERLASLSQ